MVDVTESDSPPPSKLDQWIAGLTSKERLEAAWVKLLDDPITARLQAQSEAQRKAEYLRAYKAGAITRREYMEAIPASYTFTGDSSFNPFGYRRPWLNPELVKI